MHRAASSKSSILLIRSYSRVDRIRAYKRKFENESLLQIRLNFRLTDSMIRIDYPIIRNLLI